MRLLDAVCDPGDGLDGSAKVGRGDDRWFCTARGAAAVIDGATDVGPVRLFPDAESDAAVYAETLALAGAGYDFDRFAEFADGVSGVVGVAAVSLTQRLSPLAVSQVAASALPTAAGIFALQRGDEVDIAWLGDCMAIIRGAGGDFTVVGDAGAAADEAARADDLLRATPPERSLRLQEDRSRHNLPGGYWIFGLRPPPAERIRRMRCSFGPGSRLLLMSDGFYRLVSPYGLYAHGALMNRACEGGLEGLLGELRGFERAPAGGGPARLKRCDDATALLIGAS
jgi:hypothetical protein